MRFGRVPKREKAKILAAMQSVNARLAERSLPAEFADEVQLMQSVVRAHMETCDFTRDKVQVLMTDAHRQPNYTACPPTLVSITTLVVHFLATTCGKRVLVDLGSWPWNSNGPSISFKALFTNFQFHHHRPWTKICKNTFRPLPYSALIRFDETERVGKYQGHIRQSIHEHSIFFQNGRFKVENCFPSNGVAQLRLFALLLSNGPNFSITRLVRWIRLQRRPTASSNCCKISPNASFRPSATSWNSPNACPASLCWPKMIKSRSWNPASLKSYSFDWPPCSTLRYDCVVTCQFNEINLIYKFLCRAIRCCVWTASCWGGTPFTIRPMPVFLWIPCLNLPKDSTVWHSTTPNWVYFAPSSSSPQVLFPLLHVAKCVDSHFFCPIDRSTWPEECGIGGADAIQIAFRIGKCFKSSPSGQSRTLPGIVAQNPRSAHAQYASFGKVAGLQNDGTTTATTTAAKQLQPSSANSASASQSLARLRRRRSQKPNGLRVEQRCRIHLLIRSRRRERLAAVGRRCWKRRSAFVSSSPTSRPVRKRLLFHVQRWRRNGFRPFLVEDCRIAASHPQCRSRKQRRKYQRRLPLF